MCFTPEVMLATFIIEIVLALYVFIRYGMGRFSRMAGVVLILLAIFQIAEYQICAGEHSLLWARIGFIAITLLPIAGFYLVSLITKKTHFLRLGYLVSIGYVIYFIFSPHSITGALCGGNYVIFDINQNFYLFYGTYYFGFLLLAIWESLEKMMEVKSDDPRREVLAWIIVGYISFLLPMSAIYIYFAEARVAIASIMCGFALILALILAFKIVPEYYKIKRKRGE